MATIVQPYSPWREQLLANFLGPIVGNMIQQSQQNAQNKKYNAMLGELAKAGQTPAPQVTPSLFSGFQPDNQDNSNGWERAFRQGGNELANFDANTAITPQVTPSINPYNQADMMRNFMQLMASSRFSSLNPTEAYNMATPFLQSLQAQRMTDLKNQYANNLGSTSGFDDQINLLARAAIEGAASDDTLKTMAGYAEHRQPHMTFAEMNAGDKMYRLAQNPATGQVTPAFSADVGVSPNTNATLAMQKYGYDVNANLEQQRINELVTQEQYNRDNPTLEGIYGNDGTLYYGNPKTGTVKQAATPSGQTVKVQPKVNTNSHHDLPDSSKVKIEGIQADIKYWRTRRDTLMEQMSTCEKDSPEYNDLAEQAQACIDNINELKTEMNQELQKNSTQPQPAPSVTPPPQETVQQTPAEPVKKAVVKPLVTPVPVSDNEKAQQRPANIDWRPSYQSVNSSSAMTSAPSVMPSPVSADIAAPTNNTVTVTAPSVIPKPEPPKAPENSTAKTLPKQNNVSQTAYKTVIKSISPEAEYNPERDKNISPDKVLTPQQFFGLVTRVMQQNPIFANTVNPNVIANKILQQGYKIKFQ